MAKRAAVLAALLVSAQAAAAFGASYSGGERETVQTAAGPLEAQRIEIGSQRILVVHVLSGEEETIDVAAAFEPSGRADLRPALLSLGPDNRVGRVYLTVDRPPQGFVGNLTLRATDRNDSAAEIRPMRITFHFVAADEVPAGEQENNTRAYEWMREDGVVRGADGHAGGTGAGGSSGAANETGGIASAGGSVEERAAPGPGPDLPAGGADPSESGGDSGGAPQARRGNAWLVAVAVVAAIAAVGIWLATRGR